MRNDVLRYGMLAVVVALLAAGCDRGLTLSEQEALERSTSLYKNAIDDFQAGRVDAAIKGFERVVFYEPKSYSAHFQLATLLQDVRKDYISAIAHYRNYLAHRPASDKATVALDRVKACETMLQAEMVRKAGGSASSKIAADNERLTAECDDLKKKVARLEGDLEKARRTISRLQGEAERRSQLLAKLGESFEGKVTKDAAMKDALAQLKEEKDEIRRRRLQPTDAELLDEEDDVSAADARKTADLKEAKKLAQLDDDVPARPTASTKALAASAVAGADAVGAKPAAVAKPAAGKTGGFDALFGSKKTKGSAAARPETYTVQEGDTLFKIATRFYGSSHKWRSIQDANRSIVPADGRLRIGMVLRLP